METDSKHRIKLGLRLRMLREKRLGNSYGSQAECSKWLGYHPTTWNKMERGETNLSADRVAALATAFGCNAGWLLTGEGEPFSTIERPVQVSEFTTDGSYGNDTPPDFVARPFMEGAVAGGHRLQVEDAPQGFVVLHRKCVPHGHKVTAVRYRGDSMEPIVPDGAIILIDHDDRDVASIIRARNRSRRIVVARLDDDMMSVKFLARAGQVWILLAANIELYEPIPIEPEQIMGRVIGQYVDLVNYGS